MITQINIIIIFFKEGCFVVKYKIGKAAANATINTKYILLTYL